MFAYFLIEYVVADRYRIILFPNQLKLRLKFVKNIWNLQIILGFFFLKGYVLLDITHYISDRELQFVYGHPLTKILHKRMQPLIENLYRLLLVTWVITLFQNFIDNLVNLVFLARGSLFDPKV